MNEKISCKQVKAILPFYIKGTVNPFISDLIEEHLEECESCKKLYLKLLDEYNKNYIPDISDIEINISSARPELDENIYSTNEYQSFKKKLSAYFDSELGDKEQIKMKKITISNPLARRDFENMFRCKQLLHSSFEKTKNSFNNDFSKNIINKISEKPHLKRNPVWEISWGIFFITILVSLFIYLK
ncbi:zf-HC2 domain-containing protein [bacterium]|nr:zf-HC2 domain-containing protein [bacterium]